MERMAMNIEKTWKFELITTNEVARNVQVGQRVIGSIGEIQAANEPQKLGVSLTTDFGPIGVPPRDLEADIIQTVGTRNAVILKGQVLSVEGNIIIIELSFYK